MVDSDVKAKCIFETIRQVTMVHCIECSWQVDHDEESSDKLFEWTKEAAFLETTFSISLPKKGRLETGRIHVHVYNVAFH